MGQVIKITGGQDDFVAYMKSIEGRLNNLSTSGSGSINITGRITTQDPITGVETVFGNQDDGSFGLQRFVNDIEPPPKPSTPVLISSTETFELRWDGLDSLGVPPPEDYKKTIIQMATSNPSPVWSDMNYLTAAGQAMVGGQKYGETRYFRLVSVDENGNMSVPSEVVSGTLKTIFNQEYYDGAIEGFSAELTRQSGVVSGAVNTAQTASDRASAAESAAEIAQAAAQAAEDKVRALANAQGSLIVGGGFEAEDDNNAPYRFQTASAHEGSYVGKFPATKYQQLVWNEVPAVAGKVLEARFWARADGNVGSFTPTFVLHVRDTTDTVTYQYLTGDSINPTLSGTWQEYIFRFAPLPANTKSVAFRTSVNASAPIVTGTGSIFIDDVVVFDTSSYKEALDAAIDAQNAAEAAQKSADAAQKEAEDAFARADEAYNSSTTAINTATAVSRELTTANNRIDAALISAESLYDDGSYELGRRSSANVPIVDVGSRAHKGKNVAVFDRSKVTTGNLFAYWEFVSVVPGNTYRIDMYSRAEAGTPLMDLWTSVLDSNGNSIGTAVTAPILREPVASEWRRITAYWVAPTNAAKARFFPLMRPENATSAIAWVDSVSVVDASEHVKLIAQIADLTVKADQAIDDAYDAMDRANEAVTSANGRNTITTSAVMGKPTFNGRTVGDTNWVTQNSLIKEQWMWTGSDWVTQQMADGMFANLDVGKLTGVFADIAKHLRAGSISADKITVGLGPNLIPNPNGAQGAGTHTIYTGGVKTGVLGSQAPSTYFTTLAGNNTAWANAVLVRPGSVTYESKAWAHPINPKVSYTMSANARKVSGTGKARIQARYSNAAGTALLSVNSDELTATQAWQTMRLDLDAKNAPVGAVSLEFIIQIIANGTEFWLDGYDFREMTDGSLIVNGSIQAKQINVPELNSAIVKTIVLEADNIKVDSNLIAKFVNAESAEVGSLLTTGNFTVKGSTFVKDLFADYIDSAEITTDQLKVSQTGTFSQAVINSLWTDVISTRKIKASQVLIGPGRNLVVNGMGEFDDLTNWGPDYEKITDPAVNFTPGTNAVFSTTSRASVYMEQKIILNHTSQYSFQIWAQAQNAGQVAYIELFFYDRAGTRLSPARMLNGAATTSNYIISNRTMSTSWELITGSFEPPLGAVTMSFRFFSNHSAGTQLTGQWQRWGGFSVVEKVGASLIVEGTIKGVHVDAKSVAAELIKTTELNTTFLTTEELNAGNITLTGEFRSGRVGGPSVVIPQNYRTINGLNQLGVWLSPDGRAPGTAENAYGKVAGMWVDVSTTSSAWDQAALHIRGKGYGGLSLYGGIRVLKSGSTNLPIVQSDNLTVSGTESLNINGKNISWVSSQGSTMTSFGSTTINSANNIVITADYVATNVGNNGYVIKTNGNIALRKNTTGEEAYTQDWSLGGLRTVYSGGSSGVLYTSNSAARFKTDIEEFIPDESWLERRTVSYHNARAKKIAENALARRANGDVSPYTPQEQDALAGMRVKEVGFIADEAVGTGADMQVRYDDDGEVADYQYERDGAVLTYFVRRERDLSRAHKQEFDLYREETTRAITQLKEEIENLKTN